MSKAVLYAVNSNAQTVGDGGAINFGSAVRRYGQCININNGSVVVSGSGYYDIDVNLTFETTTAGTMVVQLYKDGNKIQGASASLTTVADTVYSLTIPTLIREYGCCCDNTSVITAVVSGLTLTLSNSTIKVEKE